jgi:hypothetical protein
MIFFEPPRQQFPHGDSKGPNVGRAAELVGCKTFRGHPLVRTSEKSLFVSLNCATSLFFLFRNLFLLDHSKRLSRQSKVSNQGVLGGVEQHVATSQITMHNPFQMNVQHSSTNALRQLKDLLPAHWLGHVVKTRLQRPSIHKINHDAERILHGRANEPHEESICKT